MKKKKTIDPKEVNEVLSQLGLYTHYLATKPIDDWDEYDHSNWNALLRKSGRGRLKETFAIIVALDFKKFEHYCMEPQVFYESFEKAEEQMLHLIKTKQYKKSQLKIQKLWKTRNNN